MRIVCPRRRENIHVAKPWFDFEGRYSIYEDLSAF